MSHTSTTDRLPVAEDERTLADGARAGLVAGLAAAVANVAVFAVGSTAEAAWEVESGGDVMAVPVAAVVSLSALVPVLAGLVLTFLARRWPSIRRAWAPVVLVLGVLSLGGVLGAQDAATTVSLGLMHLVVASVAAFLLPRQLDR